MALFVSLTLAISLLITTPIVASAASSVPKTELEAVKILHDAVMRNDKSIIIDLSGLSDSDLKNIFYLDRSNSLYLWEIFYTSLAEYDDPSTSSDGDYIVNVIDYESSSVSIRSRVLTIKLDYLETIDKSNIVDEYIERAYKELKLSGMSNYNKVKAVHDYVLNLVDYDDSFVHDTPYECYTSGKKSNGTCLTYSEITYKLLTRAGVPCKIVGGESGTRYDSGGHAWNIVELGDKWYFMDNTYDDSDGGYGYFLKGSSDFEETDPSYFHKLDSFYETSYFKSTYPISSKSFNPGKDSDINTLNVGSTFPGATRDLLDNSNSSKDDGSSALEPEVNPEENKDSSDSSKSYSFSDVVYGIYPEKLYTLKKGKYDKFYIGLMDEDSIDYIKSVKVKKVKGKKNIKIDSDMYIDCDSDGYYYLYGGIVGKEKGNASIDVIVTLKNGKKKTYSFNFKIK